MVVDVPEVEEFAGIDKRQVPIRELVEDLADRADRATHVDELALQREYPFERVAVRSFHDRVLEGVDRILEPVGEREVGVHDLVADRPQQVVRSGPHEAGESIPKMRPASRIPGSRMARQQEPVADDQVDLVRLEVGRIIEREEHDVDDIVGCLELWPLVALEDVLGDERMQSQQLRGTGDLGCGGVRQVDPDHPLPMARFDQQPREVFERGVVMDIAHDCVDQHREGHLAVMCG